MRSRYLAYLRDIYGRVLYDNCGCLMYVGPLADNIFNTNHGTIIGYTYLSYVAASLEILFAVVFSSLPALRVGFLNHPTCAINANIVCYRCSCVPFKIQIETCSVTQGITAEQPRQQHLPWMRTGSCALETRAAVVVRKVRSIPA